MGSVGDETFMVVRILWLRGKNADEALEKYYERVARCDVDATVDGVLSDTDTLLVVKWDKQAKIIYEFLNNLKYIEDVRKKFQRRKTISR